MAILDDNEKPDLDELAHFGVKGMRWGHRKAQDSGGSGGGNAASPPMSNRQKNKEFRKETNKKRDAEIDAARERYNNNARSDYLKAKAQYKADKKTIGTAAARAKFNETKNKNLEDFNVAQQAKSGKETTVAVLSIVGSVALMALGAAAQRA